MLERPNQREAKLNQKPQSIIDHGHEWSFSLDMEAQKTWEAQRPKWPRHHKLMEGHEQNSSKMLVTNITLMCWLWDGTCGSCYYYKASIPADSVTLDFKYQKRRKDRYHALDHPLIWEIKWIRNKPTSQKSVHLSSLRDHTQSRGSLS